MVEERGIRESAVPLSGIQMVRRGGAGRVGPALMLAWLLASLPGALPACPEALAEALPHHHPAQVASDIHPHHHAGGGEHAEGGAPCHCHRLRPPFAATAVDSGVLPTAGMPAGPAAERATARPPVARTIRHAPEPRHAVPPLLRTCRLLI